ncbi:MAG: YhcN/YlaJ family sporulation lipoprotein [Syntrophomonadaceae bacterium]|nr:YhcN/YlaJ family sporulation lipoprotein [Syntrophomonadaceae bacterium]
MKQAKKILLILMVCTLGLSLLLAGCQTTKKPMTPAPTSKKPNVTTPAPTTNTTTDKQVTMKAAAEANKVSGVRSATAVIAGKTIYIGLDLDANLEKTKSAMVEKEVLNKVKKLYPSYTVMVSSDIDTVTRIKKVAQGIAAGKPLTSFSNEIKDIGTRMTPRTK